MKRIKCILVFAMLVLSGLIIVAIGPPMLAGSAGNNPEAGAEIKIDNFSFGPDIKIAVGSTVTWTNHDDVPHIVASDTNIFKSKALDTDDRFSYTFTKPGTYVYYCSIHPRMVAKVVVQ